MRDAAAAEYLAGESAGRRHGALAAYFRRRADPEGDRSWIGGYARGLGELPYHLAGAGESDELYDTLTDFTFLEHKATEVAVIEHPGDRGTVARTYGGVYKLQDDYELAIATLGSDPLSSQPAGTPPEGVPFASGGRLAAAGTVLRDERRLTASPTLRKGADMRLFSRKKGHGPEPTGRRTRAVGGRRLPIPSDTEVEQKLRDIEDVNRQLDEDPRFQALLRELGAAPSEKPVETPPEPAPPSMETVMVHLGAGGLSYIASPPADFPEVAPEAHQLWLGEALLASMMGDDAKCLSAFEQGPRDHPAHRAQDGRGEGPLQHRRRALQARPARRGDRGPARGQVPGPGLGQRACAGGEEGATVRGRGRRPTTHRSTFSGRPAWSSELLAMYLEALATVYDAAARSDMATGCRDELKRLQSQST